MKTVIAGLLAWIALAFPLGAEATLLPDTYPVIDIMAYPNVTTDGSTDDSVPIQQAFNAAVAAPNGAMVRFPCGVFKYTSGPAFTIPANKNVTVEGSGQECTQLFASNTFGMYATYGNPLSSFNIRDLTFVTDQAGTQTGLIITLPSGIPTGSSDEYGPFNDVYDVAFRGSDLTNSSGVKYWGTSFFNSGVSNINITGGGCNGPPTTQAQGTCYSLNGSSVNQFYSVVINLYGVGMNNCAVGVFYGDWVQGVTLNAVNATGCADGLITPSSPSGALAELNAVNSQFNVSICGICITDQTFAGPQIINNLFILNPNSIGVKLIGTTNWVISNNFIGGVGTPPSGSIGIDINGAGGGVPSNGGLAMGNFIDAVNTGIHVESSSNTPVNLRLNLLSNNNGVLGASINDYVVGSGAVGVTITDDTPRNFAIIPTCNASLIYSTFKIADSPVGTFNAHITTGGGVNPGTAFCTGAGGLYFH